MKRFHKPLIAIAILGLLSIIGAIRTSHEAVAQNPNPGSAPVNIVGPFPLPVTGLTTVSGAVAATQSGAWKVGVNGTVTVVPAADLKPYQERKQFNWVINPPCNFGGQSCEFSFSTVPAGKRLVVENISGSLVVNAGVAGRSVELFGTSATAFVPTVLQSTFINASSYTINVSVRLRPS